MTTIWAFNNIKKKHTLYYGEDCIKNLCISLREHTSDITKSENEKMLTEKN